ncbi:efflux RND transporter permease subunit [Rhodanobacter sp. OR444]|uniref:efflux RND transporter permease subunit n=1 Tax=Rhodanobacter sp. OR444 TaxID=1076525 RepID=UPI00041BC379|nr:efflux RND transporter permease subunit [Rhodanobacter sp. OR444]
MNARQSNGGRRFSLPRFALSHPHATIIIALIMVILGVYAYLAIPVRMVPKIPSPNVGVVTQFPGMSAEDMQRYITNPLEKRIQIVGGVNYLLGTSQSGYSKIVVYFDYGVDLQKKQLEMQALLNEISNELPQAGPNTTKPRLVHVNSQNGPSIQFAITRPGMSRTALKEMVNNVILTQFQLQPGVLSAYTFGGPTRQIEVEVDRTKLAVHGLSILAIGKAIDSANFNHGGGPLVDGDNRIDVQINSEFEEPQTLQRLRDLPVGHKGSQVIYLRDVAKIADTHAPLYGDFYYNGKPAIWLGVQGQNDGDFLKISENATKLAHKLEAEYPGLKVQTAFDQAFYIHLNDANAMEEFIKAVLLASLVIVLFLGELGGTVIAAAILPSAVAFGFFLVYVLGVQRDFGIMMGLVFVVGKLLDDSIVVVEVVRRHIERGFHPKVAAVLGAEQVQNAILAATLTFAVMLYPMSQLSGDMGAGFHSMTVPMITSVIGSYFLAMTITPLMASVLFKPKPGAVAITEEVEIPLEEEMKLESEPPPGWLGRMMHKVFLRHFHTFEQAFMRWVAWSLHHRWIVVAGIVGSLMMALTLFDKLGVEQMPLTDTSVVLGYVRASPGVSTERMAQIVKKIEQIAMEQKNVKNVSALTGQSPGWGQYFTGYGVNEVNEARLLMNLTIAREQRQQTQWQIQDAIYRKAKAEIPDLDVLFLQPLSPTPIAASRAPVEVLVKGPDMQQVYDYGRQVLQIAQTQAKGLHNPYLDTVDGVPQLEVDVDQARAMAMGLSVKDVVGQVYYAINGGMTGTFFNPQPMDYHSRILIRYRKDQRRSLQDLRDLKIATPNGHAVPLSAVARIRDRVGFNTIHTYNTLYAASVLGYYQELGLKETTMNLLVPAKMQFSMPKGYSIGPAGLMGTMLQAFNELNSGLKVALVAVLFLLIIQFRSFSTALVLMLAIPLEGLGGIGALWLRDMNWSPPVLWGMVILAGIVLSNSILMVDLMLHFRRRGADRDHAIVAASAQRMRPVLMTAIAAGIGMLPVAIWPPPATEQFKEIATAIVGGLVTSTMMTLIAIPVAYSLMDDFVTFLRRFYLDDVWLPGRRNSEGKGSGEAS